MTVIVNVAAAVATVNSLAVLACDECVWFCQRED